jgi:hypothetical protein
LDFVKKSALGSYIRTSSPLSGLVGVHLVIAQSHELTILYIAIVDKTDFMSNAFKRQASTKQ